MAAPPFFSFSDDDFGNFTFVSPPPQTNQEEDDDWGDFVIGSQFSFQIDPNNSAPDPNSNPNHVRDKLRKGAIPLSVFGFDDDEADEPEASPFPNGLSPSSPSAPPAKKPVEVRDLIADLYGAGATAAAKPEAEEEDDDGWEFKDAYSASVDGLEEDDTSSKIFDWGKKDYGHNGIQDIANSWESDLGSYHASTDDIGEENRTGSVETTSRHLQKPNSVGLGIKDSMFHSVIALDDITSSLHGENDQSHSVSPSQFPTPDGPDIAEISPDSVSLNGDGFFDDNEWEFQKAPDTIISGQNSVCRIDETMSNGSPQDLYATLKEQSLFLMVHHLGDLKKAHEVASISGEQAKVLKIDKDIRVVRKKLQEAMVSESMYMGKHPSKDACVSKLVDSIKHIQDFEQEYHLSERILLAERDLIAAVEFYEHVTSVLHILGLASKEEQQTYITAWSKMVVACAEELRHGAMIWTESLSADVSRQILSQGNKYFLALGEIYRVSEILRASSKAYKPWLLSNQEEDNSRELLTGLDKCAEAWKSMDLEANTQLQLKAIDHFDDLCSYNHAFVSEDMICRLSLLAVGMLQGNTMVKWDGDHYCLTLANLWANRVSCCPPRLPCILAS